MCGIVGAVAQREVAQILLEGLHRLEYRGYDSAGMAAISSDQSLQCLRRVGKVAALEEALNESPLQGKTGIAHTRWATHGAPAEKNAQPHLSLHIALVQHGIIKNHRQLRERLTSQDSVFQSDTVT